tara:strand:- start:526 stop:927 length:402 start_codon:yes stop_codon:yes gene_type:complete
MTLTITRKKVGAFVLSLLLAGVAFIPHATHAQLGLDTAKEAADGSGGFNTNEEEAGVSVIVGKIIQAIISLLGIIFIGLTVYAGFLWMTARGETDQVDKSKKMLTQGVIGMAIVLAAWAITNFVLSRLISATG